MFYRLPPVGNPITWFGAETSDAAPEPFAPWNATYYGSGTQALAAALQTGDPHRDRVLLPAYGCPDLISAVVAAGAKPVLIDLQAGTPRLDLDRLADALDERTRAVVAVDLFGVPERIAAIRALLRGSRILLVEDAAQAQPQAAAQWLADLVVLSFGRGKPVSLLGGGAVLSRDPALMQQLPQPAPAADNPARFRLRALAYNCLTHPRCYWLPALLPLGLGETRYKPAPALRAAPASAISALPANLAARRSARLASYEKLIPDTLARFEQAGGVDLPRALALPAAVRLLRYPLLAADTRQREQLLAALNDVGLGATTLYGKILPQIDGVPPDLPLAGDYPQAREFAARLLTLPLHERVTDRAIGRIGRVIDRILEEGS